jgi:hypothetical protein
MRWRVEMILVRNGWLGLNTCDEIERRVDGWLRWF